MTLGRSSTGAIKIKTDSPGLRAVECACCGGGGDINACIDCPPFLADFNFSVSGDQVGNLTEFQYPANDLSDRTCADYYDAFSGLSWLDHKLFIINLNRISTNGQLSGCAWEISLNVTGVFEYDFMGEPDFCGVGGVDSKIITTLDPRGVYPMTISAQCVPPYMGGPTDFNFTVTVS